MKTKKFKAKKGDKLLTLYTDSPPEVITVIEVLSDDCILFKSATYHCNIDWYSYNDFVIPIKDLSPFEKLFYGVE